MVLPDLMKKAEYDDREKKIVKKLADIIKDQTKRNLPWDEIVKEIYEDSLSENEKLNNRWILKKILYEYSVTIPAYYFEGVKLEYMPEFKGFYIFRIKDDKKVDEIKELGIDQDDVFKHLEVSEIREFESNVL